MPEPFCVGAYAFEDAIEIALIKAPAQRPSGWLRSQLSGVRLWLTLTFLASAVIVARSVNGTGGSSTTQSFTKIARGMLGKTLAKSRPLLGRKATSEHLKHRIDGRISHVVGLQGHALFYIVEESPVFAAGVAIGPGHWQDRILFEIIVCMDALADSCKSLRC